MKKFDYKLVEDPIIREYIEDLQDEINNQAVLKCKFEFFEFEFDTAVTNEKKKHNLGFVPDAIVELYKTGVGVVTYNYVNFNKEEFDITTTGACKVKFLAGRYGKENN